MAAHHLAVVFFPIGKQKVKLPIETFKGNLILSKICTRYVRQQRPINNNVSTAVYMYKSLFTASFNGEV